MSLFLLGINSYLDKYKRLPDTIPMVSQKGFFIIPLIIGVSVLIMSLTAIQIWYLGYSKKSAVTNSAESNRSITVDEPASDQTSTTTANPLVPILGSYVNIPPRIASSDSAYPSGSCDYTLLLPSGVEALLYGAVSESVCPVQEFTLTTVAPKNGQLYLLFGTVPSNGQSLQSFLTQNGAKSITPVAIKAGEAFSFTLPTDSFRHMAVNLATKDSFLLVEDKASLDRTLADRILASITTPLYAPSDDVTNSPSFSVTAVTATSALSSTNGCDQLFTFTGSITANGAGTVEYTWLRSDGAYEQPIKLDFKAAGAQYVRDSWTLSPPKGYSGWEQLKIVAPNSLLSNQAAFVKATC